MSGRVRYEFQVATVMCVNVAGPVLTTLCQPEQLSPTALMISRDAEVCGRGPGAPPAEAV